MFSFFGKNNKGNSPTTVAAIVGAELREETSFPQQALTQAAEPGISCKKMRFKGKPPQTQFVEDDTVEPPNMAFIVPGARNNQPIAVINNPESYRFDIWTLNPASLHPEKTINIGKLHPEQGKWVSYSLLDLACLPNAQALMAVGYHNPRPKYALYRYDLVNSTVTLISEVDANAQNPYQYFQYKPLSGDNALALYYTDTKRKSAEIYHNYYNHILLFTPGYPQGIEILKLGIDVGNITEWTVVDKTLFLDTRDNRDHRNPKLGYWSLDLSRLLLN